MLLMISNKTAAIKTLEDDEVVGDVSLVAFDLVGVVDTVDEVVECRANLPTDNLKVNKTMAMVVLHPLKLPMGRLQINKTIMKPSYLMGLLMICPCFGLTIMNRRAPSSYNKSFKIKMSTIEYQLIN